MYKIYSKKNSYTNFYLKNVDLIIYLHDNRHSFSKLTKHCIILYISAILIPNLQNRIAKTM